MVDLLVNATGIRPGEYITASSGAKQSSGTTAQVRGFYPPARDIAAQLSETQLRDGLNRYAFFQPMTPLQRVEWLTQFSGENADLYLEDAVPELWLRFTAIGGFFVKQLPAEQVDMLLKGNPNDAEGYWPISYVFNLFPRKPGSKARKHTLVFRPSQWMLVDSEKPITSHNGLCFNIDTLVFGSGEVKKNPEGIMKVFKTAKMQSLTPSFAIVSDSTRKGTLSWGRLTQLAGTYSKDMERVKPIIAWFPPALFKSLIQKIIRTRCEWVTHEGQSYLGGSVLLAAAGLLLLHAGSFVPNIQRFVTGIESAFKRSAVSICEDSWLEDSRLLSLFYACAAVAQQDSNWRPTDQIVGHLFSALVKAQQEPRIFDYDWHTFSGIKAWDHLSLSYLLLGELRSFDSDIKMVGSIAERGGRAKEPVFTTHVMRGMPLHHCVDHHTYTEIAHYLPYSGMPYSEVFKKIWQELVGINPRAAQYQGWKASPFALQLQEAQKLVWLVKSETGETSAPTSVTASVTAPVTAPVPTSSTLPLLETKQQTIPFTYTLDASWLPGLIGMLEVQVGRTSAYVVIRTDDIYQMTAVKKPSRDSKSPPELTEEEKAAAIQMARYTLSQGVELKVPSTLSHLKGAWAALVGSEDAVAAPPTWFVRLATGEVKPWSEVTTMTFQLPLQRHKVEPSKALRLACERKTEHSVIEGADEIFATSLASLDKTILRRLLTYLEGSRSEIQLHKISRDGSGVELAVVPADTGVNHFLSLIAVLYPAALTKTGQGYKVICGPLMWSLREKIGKFLAEAPSSVTAWATPVIDARKLWEHQTDILEVMKTRHRHGKRGHEIWLAMGLGKSLITTKFISYLIEEKQMPDYCVWTLPPSALDSISKELMMAHLPFQVLDMRASGNCKSLQKGMVSIVLHDHMRMNGLDEQLRQCAPHMLFIVDEFHKTLNKTLRTSITLEVVSLAKNFIGLSGTLVKDSNLDELTPWLEQIVEFEVTDKNSWVAIGALISRKVPLPIEIDRQAVEAKMLQPEHYYSLVPKGLGGTAAQLDIKGALKESYDAVSQELIRQTVSYVRGGEPVFLVAKDAAHQSHLQALLSAQGVVSYLITKDASITIGPDDPLRTQVVITTTRLAEGYTLSRLRVGITGVYFSNQATRDQLLGRLVRMNQRSPIVRWITIHAGILTYILKRYEAARSLSEALKGFAKDIGLDSVEMLKEVL